MHIQGMQNIINRFFELAHYLSSLMLMFLSLTDAFYLNHWCLNTKFTSIVKDKQYNTVTAHLKYTENKNIQCFLRAKASLLQWYK